MVKFWDSLAEGLAGTWNARLLLPAFAFWGGGLLAWVWRSGWSDLQTFLNNTGEALGISLAVGLLVLLGVSGWLVQQFTRTALRLAEGYWPPPFRKWGYSRAGKISAKIEAKKERWNDLAIKAQDPEGGGLSVKAYNEYTRLDASVVMNYPRQVKLFLPTRLGNILRAAEEYPAVRYGLETRITWPRLWLLLPEEARQELAGARAGLDERARYMVWGLLFAAWSVWAWWAVPVALAAAAASYLGMVQAAGVYGELLRSAYDLYRFEIYKALRWELPPMPCDEEIHGRELTRYLHRGQAAETLSFKNMPE